MTAPWVTQLHEHFARTRLSDAIDRVCVPTVQSISERLFRSPVIRRSSLEKSAESPAPVAASAKVFQVTFVQNMDGQLLFAIRGIPVAEQLECFIFVGAAPFHARSEQVEDLHAARRSASQVNQRLIHKASVERLVRTVHLGICLLQQAHPELVWVLVPDLST